jgi:hypothetical protein
MISNKKVVNYKISNFSRSMAFMLKVSPFEINFRHTLPS